MISKVLKVLNKSEMDHKRKSSCGSSSKVCMHAYKDYRYSLGFLRKVLALSGIIQFAAEGLFLDDEHYNCAKRFLKHK